MQITFRFGHITLTIIESFFGETLYTYGFIDEVGNGVDYPFVNSAHYPYINSFFRVIPEGSQFSPIQGFSLNTETVVTKPIIDECE